jgi:hypothetical protein
MQFIIEADQLTIQFEGLEKLWALKRRLQIPRYAIMEVDYLASQPMMRDLWGYWRLPGASLPGVFLAGSYRRDGEREFWYLRLRTPGVLTLTFEPDALKYDKTRLTCTPEIAQEIADWWHTEPRKA